MNYEYSLGLNGLGACATQYASRWFDVSVCRDGYLYELHFERGVNIGGLKKTKTNRTTTGTTQRWLPDDDVFTDIEIPASYFVSTLKQQAVVNRGVTFEFTDDVESVKETFCYPEGILGMVQEMNENGLTKLRTLPVRERRDRKIAMITMSSAKWLTFLCQQPDVLSQLILANRRLA